jgi:hypothetical protein
LYKIRLQQPRGAAIKERKNMAIRISDEDYQAALRCIGELAATKGVIAQMENELKYQRDLNLKLIELRAAPIKEQPAFAQHPQAVICSNNTCLYCQNFDGEHCNTPCSTERSDFRGRKLTTC